MVTEKLLINTEKNQVLRLETKNKTRGGIEISNKRFQESIWYILNFYTNCIFPRFKFFKLMEY